MVRMRARGSLGVVCHAGTGAGSSSFSAPCCTRIPMSVPKMLLPIDQLSSCMSLFAPLPYRSATIRPLCTTTNAAVNPAGLANAASTALRSLAVSISAGSGVVGRTSPIGQGVVAALGRLLVMRTGSKKTESRPGWWMMQPWSP